MKVRIDPVMLSVVFIILISTCFVTSLQAQRVYTATYEPLTPQEIQIYAQAKAIRDAYNEQQFEVYKKKAYECFEILDYSGFLYYSDYALSFGWYNSKMYFDRGKAYEYFHEYRKAKKEYKKAQNKGYYPAVQALEQCKENEKAWRKRNR